MLERIKELCKYKGISIAQLERDLGFANKVLFRWDSINPSVEKVKAVADYFGVSVDYLLGSEEEQKDDTLQRAFRSRPEMKQLFSVLESAPKEDIEQAIKIIEALKK